MNSKYILEPKNVDKVYTYKEMCSNDGIYKDKREIGNEIRYVSVCGGILYVSDTLIAITDGSILTNLQFIKIEDEKITLEFE